MRYTVQPVIIFFTTILLAGFIPWNVQDRYTHVYPEKIDAIFEDIEDNAPGCAAGVIDHGELIFSRGYGSANLDYGIPITPASRFMIASISKQFAAAALLLMEQEGVLDLDEDLRTYIPELPEFEAPITARQIIQHTSGLRDLFDLLHLKDIGLDPTTTTQDAVELFITQQSLNFTPNTRHIYSNSGYVLMEVLVEKLTGMTLREYTDKHFFEPSGMESTHFHDDTGLIVPDRVESYRPVSGGYGRFYRDNVDRVGARGLFTTIEDFARWDANFIENRTSLDDFIARMTEKGVFNNGRKHDYATGLRISRYRTLDTVGHGGSYMGFRTNYMRFPDFELAFVVFCNLSSINPAGYARELADLYLQNEFAEIFSKYAGTYRNEGFGRSYELKLDDGDIYLYRTRRDSTRLVWQDDDKFSAGGWNMEFLRDGDEGITGFTVQSARTGKVTFHRIE
jgi:CubicO group peptidase (beta-lactamase class C family)